MKKKAFMKVLAVAVAATMMFSGCNKTETAETSGTKASTESTVETTAEETKASETTTATEETKATEASKETEAAKESAATGDVAEITEMDKTMYCSKLVNTRAAANERAERVSALKKGQEVHVTGLCGNGWYRLEVDGVEMYVPDGYLVDSLE